MSGNYVPQAPFELGGLASYCSNKTSLTEKVITVDGKDQGLRTAPSLQCYPPNLSGQCSFNAKTSSDPPVPSLTAISGNVFRAQTKQLLQQESLPGCGMDAPAISTCTKPETTTAERPQEVVASIRKALWSSASAGVGDSNAKSQRNPEIIKFIHQNLEKLRALAQKHKLFDPLGGTPKQGSEAAFIKAVREDPELRPDYEKMYDELRQDRAARAQAAADRGVKETNLLHRFGGKLCQKIARTEGDRVIKLNILADMVKYKLACECASKLSPTILENVSWDLLEKYVHKDLEKTTKKNTHVPAPQNPTSTATATSSLAQGERNFAPSQSNWQNTTSQPSIHSTASNAPPIRPKQSPAFDAYHLGGFSGGYSGDSFFSSMAHLSPGTNTKTPAHQPNIGTAGAESQPDSALQKPILKVITRHNPDEYERMMIAADRDREIYLSNMQKAAAARNLPHRPKDPNLDALFGLSPEFTYTDADALAALTATGNISNNGNGNGIEQKNQNSAQLSKAGQPHGATAGPPNPKEQGSHLPPTTTPANATPQIPSPAPDPDESDWDLLPDADESRHSHPRTCSDDPVLIDLDDDLMLQNRELIEEIAGMFVFIDGQAEEDCKRDIEKGLLAQKGGRE